MRLYADAQTEYERTVATARLKASGTSRTLAETDIQFLVATYAHRLRKNLHETHWDDTDDSRAWLTVSAWRYAPFGFMDAEGADFAGRDTVWTNSQRIREGLPTLIAHWRSLMAEGVRSELIEVEGQTATDLCTEANLSFDPEAPAFFALCRALLQADMLTARQLLRMVDPEDATPLEVPDPPQVPQEAGNTKIAAESSTAPIQLLGLFDGYASAQGISPGVRREWRGVISQLVEFVGNGDATKLTRDHVTQWRDHLLSTPSKQGRARKPITVRDNYLVALRCTLGWAVEEGRLSANVASDVAVRIPRSVKVREKDFTKDEAVAVLRASLVKPSAKLSAPSIRARRWLPWLCAYSGARVGELAQLRTDDIRQVEGVWVLNITPEAGTVKTKQARLVPLHPHVIEQGFLTEVKRLSAGPIFYDPGKRRAANSADNRHVKKVGERLAQWVRNEVGITDTAIKPNHAWRHLFKTLASDASIDERIADAIQGHAPTTVSRNYGRVSVKAKAEAIERFPRFDLS